MELTLGNSGDVSVEVTLDLSETHPGKLGGGYDAAESLELSFAALHADEFVFGFEVKILESLTLAYRRNVVGHVDLSVGRRGRIGRGRRGRGRI